MTYVDDLFAIYKLLASIVPVGKVEEVKLRFHLEILECELQKHGLDLNGPTSFDAQPS